MVKKFVKYFGVGLSIGLGYNVSKSIWTKKAEEKVLKAGKALKERIIKLYKDVG